MKNTKGKQMTSHIENSCLRVPHGKDRMKRYAESKGKGEPFLVVPDGEKIAKDVRRNGEKNEI